MCKNDSVIDHASKPQNSQILSIFGPYDLEDDGQGHPYSKGVEGSVKETYSMLIW